MLQGLFYYPGLLILERGSPVYGLFTPKGFLVGSRELLHGLLSKGVSGIQFCFWISCFDMGVGNVWVYYNNGIDESRELNHSLSGGI